jgi:four helix bundle protein
MKNNVIKEKSMAFAIRIVNLYRVLCEKRKEYVMSKQILRAGTSIGANLYEAECAISKNDFLAKVYISFKECSETKYWLELLLKTDYISSEEYSSIKNDCDEIYRILSSITKTTRERRNEK